MFRIAFGFASYFYLRLGVGCDVVSGRRYATLLMPSAGRLLNLGRLVFSLSPTLKIASRILTLKVVR